MRTKPIIRPTNSQFRTINVPQAQPRQRLGETLLELLGKIAHRLRRTNQSVDAAVPEASQSVKVEKKVCPEDARLSLPVSSTTCKIPNHPRLLTWGQDAAILIIYQGTGLELPDHVFQEGHDPMYREYGSRWAYFPAHKSMPHIASLVCDTNDAPGDKVLRS